MDAPKIATKGSNAKQAYQIKQLWENIVNTQIDGTQAHAVWSDHWSFAKANKTLFFAPTCNIDEGIALCIHEVGHMDSDYDLIPKGQAEGGALMVFCLNIIEDILVENLQCKRMDGADCLLRETTNAFTRKNRADFDKQPSWRKRGLAVYTEARGYETIGKYPEVAEIVREANRLTESGAGLYEVAKELYVLLREKEVEEKQEKNEESGQEKEPKPKSSKDKDKPEKQPKPDPAAEEWADEEEEEEEENAEGSGGGQEDGEEEEAEGTGSGSGDGEDEAEDEDDKAEGSGSGDEDADEDFNGVQGDTEEPDIFQKSADDSEAMSDDEPSKSDDEILDDLDREVKGYGDPTTGIWEGIQAEANQGIDKVTLQFVDSRTNPVTWIRPESVFNADHAWNPESMAEAVKTAYMRLQRVLIDADEIQRKKGLKRGKLNGKALHRLQVDNDRVFTKRLRGVGVRQFAFSIVVDQSGSMAARKIAEARNSAYIIAETLDKLHIQFSVTGFNFTHKVMNYNYKDFSDVWSNRKESLRHMRSSGSNMDCHSITEVYKSLMEQPASHRVLIVISDGQPAPENPSILKDTVPLWEKDVKVVGIGLDYGDIARFYKNSIATNAEGLPLELAKLLQRVIFES